MKTYQIHLIRHAMTKGTIEGRYIGQTDEPISDEGKKQLRDIKENYGPYPAVDAVISSPLKRCTETARIIYPDKEPIIIDGLKEYDFGEFEGRTAEELQNNPAFPEWLSGANPNTPAPFGESQVRFNYRVCSAFEQIVEGIIKSGTQNTAIITHGGVIMSLMAAYAIPEAPMHEWLTPNCCGYTLRVTPSIWSRGMKAEAIDECPSQQEDMDSQRELWEVYDPDKDEYDVAYWEDDSNFPDEKH